MNYSPLSTVVTWRAEREITSACFGEWTKIHGMNSALHRLLLQIEEFLRLCLFATLR